MDFHKMLCTLPDSSTMYKFQVGGGALLSDSNRSRKLPQNQAFMDATISETSVKSRKDRLEEKKGPLRGQVGYLVVLLKRSCHSISQCP